MINWAHKPQDPASAETERSSNEEVLTSKSACRTETMKYKVPFWMHSSSWLFLSMRNYSICERRRKAFWKVTFNVFFFNGPTGLEQNNSVCLKRSPDGWHGMYDWKAAYHVPHCQVTDVCHLRSLSSSSPSASLTHTPEHTHAQTHSVAPVPSPHFQSISATYLSHHSNCSR